MCYPPMKKTLLFMTTAFYGIIFSLLFHQLNSSCFLFSDLCGGFRGSGLNELDITVHDPSRYHRRRKSPIRLTDDFHQINPPPRKSQSQSDSDLPELKSILKTPKSKNSQKTSGSSKSVSFSIETAEEKGDELPLVQISFANRNSEESVAIIEHVPYDYNLENAETVNDLIVTLNLPAEVVDMIKFNYPGLGNVRVTVLDLAALVLFATYLNHPARFFSTLNLLQFFDQFLSIFPFSLPLIQSIKVNPDNLRVTKMKAFEGIHGVASKYSLYYTLEAVYKTFGQGNEDVFIKESVKVGDMKILLRFLNEHSDINPEKLIIWALKFGNQEVFSNFIHMIGSLQNLKKHFKIPIICHVARKGFYFRGIVDMLLPLEEEFFNEVLSLSISKGNYRLFKDLIRLDNSIFEREHDPRILNVLRSIFYNQLSEGIVTEFDSEDSLKEIFFALLFLNSDDPLVISSFKTALKDLDNCAYCEELLLESLFLKNREYFKAILGTFPDLKYLIIVDHVKMGIWELVKDSRVYLDVLQSLMKTRNFTILHAISNLEFPEVLWSDALEKCKRFQLISEIEYKVLSRAHGFNEDILRQLDLIRLGLNGKRAWSLLELAIMNFNLEAVEAILEKFPVDGNQKQAAANLAKSLKDLVDSNEYSTTHPMTTIAIKQRTLDRYKERLPEFYFKGVKSGDSLTFIMKLRWNIKHIAELLN